MEGRKLSLFLVLETVVIAATPFSIFQWAKQRKGRHLKTFLFCLQKQFNSNLNFKNFKVERNIYHEKGKFHHSISILTITK